jgi:predicted metalloendopeptidase
MDAATALDAGAKLQEMRFLIGGPVNSSLRNASAPTGTLLQQVLLNALRLDRALLRRLNETVDRDAWDMLPFTVNAYYTPTLNSVVLPAGILRAPFLSTEQPLAAVYGAIGCVIGHECCHSLDDQGRYYTADGLLLDWWSPESESAFRARAACVSDLFSNYSGGNGALELGEAIADLGGLRQAYAALQRVLSAEERTLVPLAYGGLSAEQLFFVSFAQSWCSRATPGYEAMLIATNSHPLPRFRVRGALSNSEEFARAFSCPLNSAYNPAQKCVVW